MSVIFTQFILPYGRQEQIEIELSPEVEAKAQEIVAKGFCFEAEVLRTGQWSFTIGNHDLEMDLAFAICPNGPQVPEKISAMIMAFDPDKDYGEGLD